ncbi:MAG: Do family serine endopeptidase [Blastocatellia bacterium]|nr:Do family serine endopeptidase [Blastocatellia bacterium]
MARYQFLFAISIISVLAVTGCRTGLFAGDDAANVAVEAPPPPPLVVDGVRTSYADVVERTSAAVVRIEAESTTRPRQQVQPGPGPGPAPGPMTPEDFFRQFPMPRQEQRPPLERGMGSGVIVSADGTIMTNAHVIEGAQRVTVLTNDNRTFEAKLVGIDPPSDLAVLKIEAQNLPFLTLGNSDTVRVGDIVLAIGNPLGIGQTVTAGIISAKGRRTGLSDGSFEDFLQTDAPINRGNSGGALVNLSAELIGINSQILSTSGGNIGIGFSIPSNMARSVLEQLLTEGRVRRGMLGVNIQNITGDTARALELPEASGVIVSNVQPGSAAERAGVRRGDIITAINGEKVDDGNVLRNRVAGTLPGSEVRLTVLRDGASQELAATLGEFNTSEAAANSPSSEAPGAQTPGRSAGLGLTLQPLTPQTARQFNVPEGTEGLIVADVDAGSVAADAGIARGDILLEINRQGVSSPEAVESITGAAGDKPLLLLISRKGQNLYLTVRVR